MMIDESPTLEFRFLSKVKKTNTCWLWCGAKYSNGYGVIMRSKIKDKKISTGAHRIAYILYKGEIPPGLEVCHTCDIRHCVNPDHLFIGTHLDNMRDCNTKGRYSKHNAKLTSQQVLEIRQKYVPYKYTQEQLAEEYQVGRAQISRIVNKNRWSWL